MERSQLEDLVAANRILAAHGVIDAYGHVSLRSPDNPNRFFLARAIAPETVQIEDILEYDLDAKPVDANGRDSVNERFIHSEIYRARADVMAVVHHHSPAVLPFCIARGARLRPVCHMSGFLGGGAPLFEIRDHAGDASDLLIRNRGLGAALARTLGLERVVLMRGHGCTVVAESTRVAVYRAVYTEVNARLLQQALALGEVNYLTPAEADATRITNEGQAERPWNLWRQQAQEASG